MVVFVIKNVIIAVLIPLLVLITIQICLNNPNTREMFTNIESYENIEYNTLPASNTVVVKFQSKNYSDLEIYFNGNLFSDFPTEDVDVEIGCDGIFEIKNNSNQIIEVAVFCENQKVIDEIYNSRFNPGINQICKIKL